MTNYNAQIEEQLERVAARRAIMEKVNLMEKVDAVLRKDMRDITDVDMETLSTYTDSVSGETRGAPIEYTKDEAMRTKEDAITDRMVQEYHVARIQAFTNGLIRWVAVPVGATVLGAIAGAALIGTITGVVIMLAMGD